MRIGIITHNYPSNSKERKDAGTFVYDFAMNLISKGCEVYILSPNFKGKKENYTKAPVTWFTWLGGKKKLGDLSLTNPTHLLYLADLMIRGPIATIKFVKKNKIDFCICMWAYPSGFFTIVAKKFTKVPYGIITLGSDIFVYTKFLPAKYLISYICKNADALFGNSYRICDAVENLSKKKCEFLALSTSLKIKIPKNLKIKNKKFTFLFVGRLEKVKGPDILIESAKILKKQKIKFEILMVGPGTMYEFLKEKINQYKLQDYVKLLGPIFNRKKLSNLFLTTDSLVIPSRSESMPFVLIEAIYAGLPAVTTTVGDMKKMVNKYKIGFTTDPENPKKLAVAMTRAIKEGKNFKNRRKRNFDKPRKIYDTDVSIKSFIKKINKVLE
ncbi:MAG: glycosyltransferase [Candidatus Woesebacteria bacterium]|nr:MAG: glycosyltransferase [Candidatus Woesebacteria bacterium]